MITGNKDIIIRQDIWKGKEHPGAHEIIKTRASPTQRVNRGNVWDESVASSGPEHSAAKMLVPVAH